MQGRKEYTEKLFVSFQLSERVPKENFYLRLKEVLDLHFIYDMTKKYYGSCRQKSVDAVVFFKLCLVGYLENITSDRALVRHSSMRLDILYFVDHDIDDKLPCHSSISRTRQLFPEEVFEEVFEHILMMCMEKGMMSGHTQTVDSAPVKANASMDSLELKVPKEKLDEHLRKVRTMSEMEGEKTARIVLLRRNALANNTKNASASRRIERNMNETTPECAANGGGI